MTRMRLRHPCIVDLGLSRKALTGKRCKWKRQGQSKVGGVVQCGDGANTMDVRSVGQRSDRTMLCAGERARQLRLEIFNFISLMQ